MEITGDPAKKKVLADFPYKARFADVLGARMHYVDEGAGDPPVLFLHGNPTSSYLWRNIIPYMVPHARCIAADLIGMGKSDKPDLDYRFVDHAKYLESFISKVDLNRVVIVGHDWGAALGLYYAMRHETKVAGVVFMETFIKPFQWREMGIVERFIFKMFRHPIMGPKMIMGNNFLIEKGLPMLTRRKLSEEEMDNYRRPYTHPSSRKPIQAWPREIPIDGEPRDVHDIICNYRIRMERSSIPKLLLWGSPGLLIKKQDVRELREKLKNLKVAFVGRAKHYLQEDQPHRVGSSLAEWYLKTQKGEEIKSLGSKSG